MPSVKLRPKAAVTPPATNWSLRACFIVSTAALTDESVQGSLPLKSWSYLSGPAWRTYTLSNQSVRVHESPAPSPSGVWPFALRSVSSFVNEFQSVAADTPAVLNLSGRNHTVLLLLNFTMIAYCVPSTSPISRMPGG